MARQIILSVIFLLISSSLSIPFQTKLRMKCPENLKSCRCHYPNLSVDCSRKNLTEQPDTSKLSLILRHLDLSYNRLTSFQISFGNFFLMESLDLSNNNLSSISSEADFPPNLRTLHLSYNNISDWFQLNAAVILKSALKLETLSLAGNPLHTLTGNDDRLLLISNNLKLLDLSDCKIQNIVGRKVLSGLTRLEHLILNKNPLHTLPDLYSDTLLSLDLSACKLTHLRKTVFSNMPILTYVNLSENHRLSLFHSPDDYVTSPTMRRIDLSKCNMDSVELRGFPNLTTVILRGNLINQLTANSFENNSMIENLDLSYNAINQIELESFYVLKHLRLLDLSFNMIRRIEGDTFKRNLFLTVVNLSRNYIERFQRINSLSLTYMNLSWCEILIIADDALNSLPELIELDLSNNLFSEFPIALHSNTLQILDLSRCRLSTIRNTTFRGFPELSRLNLAGNRFTTVFRKQYFNDNLFLNDIWLSDNPWRCECYEHDMEEFFQYLVEPPFRIKDQMQLRCTSPDKHHGKRWEKACADVWFPSSYRSAAERFWTATVIIMLNLSLVCCVVYGFKQWSHKKKEERDLVEQMNAEAEREILRHNAMILEQEAQLNAPDPRETHPPCYEDAILLPRLDSSFASLKRAGIMDDDELEFKRAVKRSRSRSEEILIVSDDGQNGRLIRGRRHIRAARIRRNHNIQADTIELPQPKAEESTSTTTAEITAESKIDTIDGNRSDEPNIMIDTISLASSDVIIEAYEQIDTNDRSPYAQRKNRTFVDPVPSSSASETERDKGIVIIEDHYTAGPSLVDDQQQRMIESENSSLNSLVSEEDFSNISKREISNLRRTDF